MDQSPQGIVGKEWFDSEEVAALPCPSCQGNPTSVFLPCNTVVCMFSKVCTAAKKQVNFMGEGTHTNSVFNCGLTSYVSVSLDNSVAFRNVT